ncbi:recombinase family protein [Pedobacter sp. KBW06]|uniref:recombinase family protein n=1 Tax=Pedobacter sp. KBW06 TaxID=2153359 RepID=UPI000F5AD08A|nr:recombinase family protein [Pedobacter sp. KBW06]RQO75666.1 recombinase family protein [Pedobacter sp. KBW06]
MKRACLYIRVSTDEQADKGFSQRDQAERLQVYCEKNDIEVGKVIFEDHSAKTFFRPEWIKLLAELKKTKGKNFNYVMFTKWDRFSRNTADAYQMIRILTDYAIDPVAIEQPLDLSVPESKTILAVYLSMPEVENDRRALNVTYGMRRAKKEGRWMGVAPPGYKNKITEDGKKYIGIQNPEATHMKWAFEKLAEGIYATEHVWMLAKERGLKCSNSSFWIHIKNPVYCGKITIHKFKDEEMYLVDGTHEPLITESLFYKVQDVINSRKRKIGVNGAKVVSPRSLPLRGFLSCPHCSRTICGSASKGRKHYYYYYHCITACKVRYRADMVNTLFERLLKRFIPRPGMDELFKMVVRDSYNDDSKFYISERRRIAELISQQNVRINKSRELLLTEDINSTEYHSLKKESMDKIVRYEAELKDLTERVSHGLDIEDMLEEAVSNLKNLLKLYLEAEIEDKRYIIGSIFTEKWVFDGEKHRTGNINEAALLIYHINNKLRHKKTGVKLLESFYSGLVHL